MKKILLLTLLLININMFAVVYEYLPTIGEEVNARFIIDIYHGPIYNPIMFGDTVQLIVQRYYSTSYSFSNEYMRITLTDGTLVDIKSINFSITKIKDK